MADPSGIPPDILVTPPDQPDVMNDPQYATNPTGGEDGSGEADTCRICRVEGSDTEPLFHPCKCSGSIKHVHQDCLMEWLSHSQKKYCELCKTPFRFTKLYAPNMPQDLPTGVFIRRSIVHAMQHVATWLRFCLVVFVWLGWLPYVIRQIWRLLFWFSDGGWPSRYMDIDVVRDATQILENAIQQVQNGNQNGTCPASPLHASSTTPAREGRVWSLLMRLSDTVNISQSDALDADRLSKAVFHALGIPPTTTPQDHAFNASMPNLTTGTTMTPQNPSLLSGVPVFGNMTRNPHLNQVIVTVAEGYVITILVVISFILIFLIREWVVQQQFGANLRAGFNQDLAAPDRPAEPVAPEEPEPANLPEPRDVGQRPMARPRRRNVQPEDPEAFRRAAPVVGPPPQPLSPDVAATMRLVEIQRVLAELPSPVDEETTYTEEFLVLWKRGNYDPVEVLRLMEEENTLERMAYWARAMHALVILESQPSTATSRPGRRTEVTTAAELDEMTTDELDARKMSIAEMNARIKDIQAGGTGMGRHLMINDEPDARIKNIEDGDTSGRGDVTGVMSKAEWDAKIEILENSGVGREEIRGLITKAQLDAKINSIVDANIERIEKRVAGRVRANESEHGSLDSWEDVSDSAEDLEGSGAIYGTHDDLSTPQQSSYDLSSDKGKARDIDPRPQAASDEPQSNEGISNLGANNWDFNNLMEKGHESPAQPTSQSFENEHPIESSRSADSAVYDSNHSSVEEPIEGSEAWRAAREERIREAVRDGRQDELTLDDYAFMGASPPMALDPIPFGPVTIRHQDGTERTYNNWDDAFDANPFRPQGEESEDDDAEPEPNPSEPDIPPPAHPEQVVARPAEPQGIFETIADWLWGGVEDRREDQGANGEDDEAVLARRRLALEPENDPLFERADFVDEDDPEEAEEAMDADLDPNDPDAIDEAEDFEGIMELIGMRGPIYSLGQNALFSAFLLALTVAFGVWIPYNIGRVSVLLAANPGPAFKLPLKLIFWCAAFLQDLVATVLGFVSYCFISLSLSPLWLLDAIIPGSLTVSKGIDWASAAWDLSNDAVERILHGTVNSVLNFKNSDIFTFSAASHESLLTLGSLVKNIFSWIGFALAYPFVGGYSLNLSGAWVSLVSILQTAWQVISATPRFLLRPDSWVISLEVAKRSTPLNPELSAWNGVDRFWATIAGYATLCVLGAMYVKKGTPFSTGPVGREWEATVIDVLHQAGGVMKVILIISIEMLVFPLYCGLLLDAALLPLFASATIMSRIHFTLRSPLTSVFVHWFVGTCYMFHFALFVSMCRKIMRKGVLYFIRDPDDPTFHPVRDVLERNVATQLRKILFSAFVYGALVVVCLGGVVWGIAFAFKGVLPIHWSSNEPVLEFPIDLLFYNFLMPLAVRFFKPSDGLHAMYTWWFRQCARMLRLTWFLFDERRVDEEGYNVRRTWSAVFWRLKADPLTSQRTEDPQKPFIKDPKLDVYFRRDGRYVRAPASDQVRIPKGSDIFLLVDENNNRIDGKWDSPDGSHGRESRLFKQVYVPPHFRARIFIFILSLWVFMALTGVCISVVPLVFGRHIFSKMLPSHVRKNDVYAFSIGVYILGSALYGIVHLRSFISYVISSFVLTRETPQNVLRLLTAFTIRVARIVWTYAAFVFVLPTLFAFAVEFYAIVPLHTYFSTVLEPHTIYFVQSWTLGLLYVKLTTRVILFYVDSPPAISLRAITRDGYLNPDAKLATRAFILPGCLILNLALALPYCIASFASRTFFKDATEEQQILVYRYVYPAVLAVGAVCWVGWLMVGMVQVWRGRIRDEVYLIGERLHNFGDRKATGNGVGIGVRRIET